MGGRGRIAADGGAWRKGLLGGRSREAREGAVPAGGEAGTSWFAQTADCQGEEPNTHREELR
jgi:hypothetical protein